MNENEKKTLQLKRKYILDNVLVQHIKDDLIAKGVFTPNMMQEIDAEKTDQDKIGKLLDRLETRGPQAFTNFCDCLSENHSWVKEELENTYKEVCNTMEENNHDWLDNLGDNRRITKVSDAELSRISRDLGHEWIHLAKLMGFTQGRIDHFQASAPYSPYQQVNKMLSDWKAKSGGKATIENFVTLLRQAEVDENVYRPVLEGTNNLS